MPVKIVVTAPWGKRLGGAENMLWTFLRHVDRSRIEPVVVFFEHGPFPEEVRAGGVETHVFPVVRLRNGVGTLRAIAALSTLIRRVQPDLVLDWTTKSHVIGGLASLCTRRRSAWWQHGFPGRGALDRTAAALPARVVFCSSEAVAAAQRSVSRTRAVVVHPFVDMPSPARTVSRAELGIPAARFVVGIVGRLQPWKRQHLVIEAARDLADTHVLVVGGDAHGLSPEYPAEVRATARRLDMEDRVTFTGHVADPGEYLPVMDVLVNASAREPFGMVLLEAMAAGVPVVAFASGGPLEIIEDGATGLLVDGEPLASALERLARDPDLRDRLASAAHSAFVDRFAVEKLVRRLENELLELVRP